MIERRQKELDIFSGDEIEKIHAASMEIMEKNGIEFLSREACNILADHGVRVEGKKAYFKENQVLEYLKGVPSRFTLHARNPANNVEVGGRNTVLAPGYGAPFIMDMEQGKRRKSNFADYVAFTKLAGHSPNIDLVGGVLVEPADIPDNIRHARMLHAAVKETDKCLMGSAMGGQKAGECLEMAAIIFEDREFVQKNAVFLSLINTNSPLQIDGRMLEALMVYARHRQPVVIASLSMTGTTAPTTLAGALVQQNAEILAGIVFAQMVNPGTPVIYGSASSVVNLRTGGLAIGSPETAKMFAGTAQLARFYGVPSRGGGSLTDALIPDAQSGYESMMILLAAVQSGINFILHSMGLLENYMTMCFEKFIMDDEMCGMVKNFFQGIPLDADHLAKDVILSTGSGGNYISDMHTFKHMRDLRDPIVSMRRGYTGDLEIKDTSRRATEKYKSILEAYEPPALKENIEKELLTYIEGLSKN